MKAAQKTAERLQSARVPPQSVEAEQSVIGAVLLSPDALVEVADLLREEDFYRRDHRLIWRAILALANGTPPRPFDAVTLGEWLESEGLAEQIGGTGYLVDLASSTPSAANVRAYAEIVHEKAMLRRLIERAANIVDRAFQPGQESAELLLADAQRSLSEIERSSAGGGPVLAKPALKQLFVELQALWESGATITGVPTPWDELNRHTFGMQPADLIILAGRPSMGKTIAAECIGTFAAGMAGAVGIWSCEMTRKQWLGRAVARVGRVPHAWLRSPASFPDQDHWAGVNQAMQNLAKLPLHIDDTRGLRAIEIAARARRLHRTQKLKLVIVDHLHILPIPGENESRERGEDSRIFKQLAAELNCPVVVLAQLNRSSTKANEKRPTMADLRGSGEIEQNADEIWLLHREDYYHKNTHLRGVVELIIGKSRNAPAGETIYLKNRYSEMALDEWNGPLPEAPAEGPARAGRGGVPSKRSERPRYGERDD